MRAKGMSNKPADKPAANGHSAFWHKRYWHWMGRGCKPAEAARRATEDETPQVHEFRVKGGAKR